MKQRHPPLFPTCFDQNLKLPVTPHCTRTAGPIFAVSRALRLQRIVTYGKKTGFGPHKLMSNAFSACSSSHWWQWRLFIFISRESKWGTLQSAGNPRCAVPAEIHWICTDRPRPGPAAGLQVSPTSDTSQSVSVSQSLAVWCGVICTRSFQGYLMAIAFSAFV